MTWLTRVERTCRDILHELRSRGTRIPERTASPVPYISQFSSPEVVEVITKKEMPATDDPEWSSIGAHSPDHYARWVRALCGMASTQMALCYYKLNQHSLIDLAEDALSQGVYFDTPSGLSGLQHEAYVEWAKRHGLSAVVHGHLTLRGIRRLLADGSFLLASVNPNIRGYESVSPEQQGGHLVLVTGYDTRARTFTLHNPSGFKSNGSQADVAVPCDVFRRFFSGRGISIHPLNV